MNPDTMIAIQQGLAAGAVLSVLLTAASTAALTISRDFAAHDYPPAIRQRYGAKSAQGQRVATALGPVLLLLILAVLSVTLAQTSASLGPSFTFVSAWTVAFTALLTFNLYDLIVLDWLLFCTLTPRVLVLPGTEGMKEYRDYAFHARGFIRGLGFSLAISFLVAGATFTLRAGT